jgi:hypothetical protein
MFTFNVVRLALVSALSKVQNHTAAKYVPPVLGVAAGEVRQTGASMFGTLLDVVRSHVNYQFVAVHLSSDRQVLLASLGVAFAAYEVIAKRPRAAN